MLQLCYSCSTLNSTPTHAYNEGDLQTPSHGFKYSSVYHCHFWFGHRSLQSCQLTDSFVLVLKWQLACIRQLSLSGLSVRLLMVIMPTLITLYHWNRGSTTSYSKMFTLRDGSPSICLLKGTLLHQDLSHV